MLRIASALAIWLGLFSNPIIVAEEVSLKAYLEGMLTVDREIQSILAETKSKNFAFDVSLPSDHMTLNVDGEFGKSLKSDFDDTHSLGTNLNKPFSSIGGEVELGHVQGKTQSADTTTTSITYSQDLWRNGFGSTYALQRESIDYGNKILDLEIAERIENRLVQLAHHYLDYIANIAGLQIKQNELKSAQKLSKYVERKAANAIANSIDLNRSRLQVLQKTAELEALEQENKRLKSIIFEASGRDFSPGVPQDWKSPEGLNALVKKTEEPFDRHLEIIKLKIHKTESELRLTRDALEPSLGLSLGAQNQTTDTALTRTEQQEILLGLTFSTPIGTDRLKDGQRREKIYTLEKTQSDRELYLSQKRQRAIGLLGTITEQTELIDLHTKRRNLARQIAQAEEQRFNRGRIELDRLISAQELVSTSETAILKHQIALRKAIVDVLAMNDRFSPNEPIVRILDR